jgi:pimeloyl-ACP methyl ester carboxylesterase
MAKIRELVEYWGTTYDWRRAEAKLNALPQYATEIDGLDIHFIHVRSKHENAMPLIMTHAWPGSILELIKVIGPLTDPTAHGGDAADAFRLVIPSMPGYGFSARPTPTGWNPDRIERAWNELMTGLGYERYVAQGGDWGAVTSDRLARMAPAGLMGIHVNMPATVPPDVAAALQAGDPAPASLSPEEKVAYEGIATLYSTGGGYGAMQVTRPQTIGYSRADSPVGMAAWFYDKFADWTYSVGDPERSLTKDEMLDDITLYWLTNTGTSSTRLYWENNANNFNAVDIDIPAAITVFPVRRHRLAQLGATHAGGVARHGRARRLVDVHLRQLDPHAPVPSRLGGEVPRSGSRDCRHPHAGVALRTVDRQREAGRTRHAGRLSDLARQDPPPSVRRGRL